jgi:hypothetical protein
MFRFKEYGHLGCNAVEFGKSPMFVRNISRPSSELKRKPGKKPAESGAS